MADISITPGRTWVTGETVTAAKLNTFMTAAVVDSDDFLPAGTMIATFQNTTADSGWVFMVGRTIGNASSGGTERANADTEDLFTVLWNSLADGQAPVSTGRGGSASADFAANKTITVPNMQGQVMLGKDNGVTGTSRNKVTDADADTMGAEPGDETQTPADTLSVNDTTVGSFSYNTDVASGSGGNGTVTDASLLDGSLQGGVSAVTVVQPALTVNYQIKL